VDAALKTAGRRPLRILMVSDVSPAAMEGGGERVVGEEAARLAALGHHVRVLSRAPAGDPRQTVELGGARIRHFQANRRSVLRLIHSSIFAARRAAVEELSREGANVLHLHQPLSAYGVLHSPAGRRLPSLYTFLSPAPLEYRVRQGMTVHHRGGSAGTVGTLLLWAIERACLKRAARIHVLSDFSADQLWRLYGISSDRIVKIPGGADVDRFRPAARASVRKALGLPLHSPVLLTVRNLEARMGLDVLIRAVARVRSRVPDVLLLVGGSGSLRGELESLAASLDLADHVRFLGFVPEAELPLYYQVADAFVLPTRELEGFGLVTVEALACGTPVLGTPVGATPEILRPLDPALLFRDQTAEGMADGILRFLALDQRDPAATDRLRQACRDHATARYAWDASVARLAEVLAEVATGRPGPAPAAPACPVCDERMAADLCYRGSRYLRCRRCRTGAVADLPTRARLRMRYEVEYPAAYDHEGLAPPRAEMFAALLDQLARLRGAGRLLDVGCGGGHLLDAARRRGWRGIGVDLSHAACRATRRQQSIPAVQADLTRLPVKDGGVEAVTLVNVLDHLPDPLGALREIRQALVPGGHLVVRIPNAGFHRPWVRLLASLGPVVRWRGWDCYPILHLYAFTPAGARQLVRQAGFHVLGVRNSALAAAGAGGPGLPPLAIRRWASAAVTAGGRALEIVTRGRCLWGPSIEVYAMCPAGETADRAAPPPR
jgi:glycosyltransferase involved in cell wall biosynthesis/SAM-dependent methyltransferase